MNGINKTLIIAPHPDDEVLGCGGIIKKFTLQKNNVWVLIITRGKPGLYSAEKIRNVRGEALKAHEILGVTETKFLEFPAPELDLISVSELASAISSVIKELQPETIYLPHRGDIHHDHKAVFNAGLVAARPVGNNPVKNVFCYETLSETEWAAPYSDDVFVPNRFVDVSDVFDFKLKAMNCFKSQLKASPNPRSLNSIEALANFRGSTVGFEKAEAFMVIRMIEQ